MPKVSRGGKKAAKSLRPGAFPPKVRAFVDKLLDEGINLPEGSWGRRQFHNCAGWPLLDLLGVLPTLTHDYEKRGVWFLQLDEEFPDRYASGEEMLLLSFCQPRELRHDVGPQVADVLQQYCDQAEFLDNGPVKRMMSVLVCVHIPGRIVGEGSLGDVMISEQDAGPYITAGLERIQREHPGIFDNFSDQKEYESKLPQLRIGRGLFWKEGLLKMEVDAEDGEVGEFIRKWAYEGTILGSETLGPFLEDGSHMQTAMLKDLRRARKNGHTATCGPKCSHRRGVWFMSIDRPDWPQRVIDKEVKLGLSWLAPESIKEDIGWRVRQKICDICDEHMSGKGQDWIVVVVYLAYTASREWRGTTFCFAHPLADWQKKYSTYVKGSKGQTVLHTEDLHTCANAACGKVESAPMQFSKCGGCHSVYYCSSQCSKEGWKAGHKDACKELAQERSSSDRSEFFQAVAALSGLGLTTGTDDLRCTTGTDDLRFCGNPCCGKVEEASKRFLACGGCKAINYCSKECQKAGWKAGHKVECVGRK